MIKELKQISKIKRLIEKSDIVSFDIFDTILLRPYVKPTDLFSHIERFYSIPGFAENRIKAERKARRNHSNLEDISYDMIYKEIGEKYQKYKEIELKWERETLQINPEIKNIYNYAKALNKKIIFTSDMYLPKEFLEKILQEKGIEDYQRVYVSNEINRSKSHNTIWNYIIEDLQIKNPKKIFHIGDNRISDYRNPKKIGLLSYQYIKPLDYFLSKNKSILNFLKKYPNNLEASLLIGFLNLRYVSDKENLLHSKEICSDYWKKIGYLYSGPLSFAYAKFIIDDINRNKIDHVLCISREGYLIKKILNLIDKNIKVSYVYAQRILYQRITLDYNKKDINCTSLICKYAQDNDKKIKNQLKEYNPKTSKDFSDFIDEHINDFREISRKSEDIYNKYLSSIITPSEKIAVAADMGHFFSAQKLISLGRKNNIRGIYLVNSRPFSNENNISYCGYFNNKYEYFSKNDTRYFSKNWDLVEFLISSPEHPVYDITSDGKPIYFKDIEKNELLRSKVYPEIVDGAERFAKDFINLFKEKLISFNYNILIAWLNAFIENPSAEDINEFTKICFFRLVNNSIPSVGLSLHLNKLDYIFHIKRTKKTIKQLEWKSKFQRWYLRDFAFYHNKTNNEEEKRFFGFLISKCVTVGQEKTVKRFEGLFKRFENPRKITYYIFNRKVFQKKKYATVEEIEKLTEQHSREVVDLLASKVTRALNIYGLHKRTFSEFRNKHECQDIALVGAGPTVNYLEPLDNVVYVGLNRAYLKKEIKFTYLFTIDKAGLDTGKEKFYNGFFAYDCIKFVGDQNMGKNFQIPQNFAYKNNVRRYKTTSRHINDRFTLDIDSEPLGNSCSCSLQAMQFILFTNPKRVFVYGIDCTCATGEHFIGGSIDNEKRSENPYSIDQQHIMNWKAFKNFCSTYYPFTKIYIVNPVGLKGIFNDVYTKSYLKDHPEIDQRFVKILEREITNEN